jgi:hypothetical protein
MKFENFIQKIRETQPNLVESFFWLKYTRTIIKKRYFITNYRKVRQIA